MRILGLRVIILNIKTKKKGVIFIKALVDKSGCIACELCVETCPEVFRMGSDGFAEAYAEVGVSQEDSAAEARDNCPVAVISLED